MRLDEIFSNYHAKRAVEVALAGDHSIQFIGPWQSAAFDFENCLLEHRHFKTRSMAPCPCGYRGHPTQECTCTTEQVAGWVNEHFNDRLSFDITVEIPPENPDEVMDWLAGKRGEPEEKVLERVADKTDYTDLTLDETCQALLRAAVKQLDIPCRVAVRTIQVARTIANLAHSEPIHTAHLAEAIQYRPRKR